MVVLGLKSLALPEGRLGTVSLALLVQEQGTHKYSLPSLMCRAAKRRLNSGSNACSSVMFGKYMLEICTSPLSVPSGDTAVGFHCDSFSIRLKSVVEAILYSAAIVTARSWRLTGAITSGIGVLGASKALCGEYWADRTSVSSVSNSFHY